MGATSPDQLHIEDYLVHHLRPGHRLLHVGVGNSGLARRFAGSAVDIDGLTVSPAEVVVTCEAGLTRYRVHLQDKYDPRYLPAGPYHWIVDNNPTSYACCHRHAWGWLRRAAAALSPGGRFLTHARGLQWSANGFGLGERSARAVACVLGLRCVREAEGVLGLQRGPS